MPLAGLNIGHNSKWSYIYLSHSWK